MTETPFIKKLNPEVEFYDTHVPDPWAAENPFLNMPPEQVELPSFEAVRRFLPDPFWTGHAGTISCYWRAWELAFGNLKQPTPQNDFVSNYCDTAFNGNLFMWDSAFITCFGVYGRRAFNFQKTLDNFYCKQHADGFICREISEENGQDAFQRFDPSSTGPNVLAWVEWNHYLKTGDPDRLKLVFPALLAFHYWLREYRTWPDGSYWSTGWGTGMDNLPRIEGLGHPNWGHGHMTWVDTTLQAILSAKTLLQIAAVIGVVDKVQDLSQEVKRLVDYANRHLWSNSKDFYFDRLANGKLSTVKHIGAFWALLAGCAPKNRLRFLLTHLEYPGEFNRLHRVPALSADDPHYSGTGDYWCGGVWAPTNYMVLKGLGAVGQTDLAHQIGLNHLEHVVHVYELEDTPWTGAEQFRQYFHLDHLKVEDKHTLWENYAPDVSAPGSHSKPGYVGWTGIPPVAVLLEDVFGIVPDTPGNTLTWNINLLEEHGVQRYPFGAAGILSLKCRARKTQKERPSIEISSNTALTLELIWKGGRDTIKIPQGSSKITPENEGG